MGFFSKIFGKNKNELVAAKASFDAAAQMIQAAQAAQAAVASQAPTWRTRTIQDAWFEAHFNYAADVVQEWVGQERLERACILNFGCGDGITDLALILRHRAKAVLGVDISQTHLGLLKMAQKQIDLDVLPANLAFQRIVQGERLQPSQKIDVIISWSTFEHVQIADLGGIFDNLYDILADDGVFFLQINPLYYSPQGSHLARFGLPQWAHLLWSPEKLQATVMAYDGEISAEELEENFHTRSFADYKAFIFNEYTTLNGLTRDALVQHLNAHGFEVVREVNGKVTDEIPPELLEKYAEVDLRTEEIRLLLKKVPK